MDKKIKTTTKRTNINSIIAGLESRQEFVPLVGDLIDRAHVQPLHLKNNACALAQRYILNVAVQLSDLRNSNSFFQVLPTAPFYKFVDLLRKLKRLAKKIK